MLLDITNLLAEYDDLMHDTFNVLISEYAKDNEEFNNILAYHIKKIKEIAKAEEPNYVYDCYPFLGIMNPYDKNIKALDELYKLMYEAKAIGYDSKELNDQIKKLLICERKNLITLCKYYVPRNKQANWLLYAENKIYKRNLLKNITYNFYYSALVDDYKIILSNIFNGNLKDDYKILVLQALLDYHYNQNEIKNEIKNVLKIN